MQHVLVLVRDVSEDEATLLRQMAEKGEPHTWKTFAPFRDSLFDDGFVSGETAVIEDDGKVVMHTLVNIRDSVLRIEDETLNPKACDAHL